MRINTQRGFTLSSLLTGLFIAAMVSTMVIQHYLNVKQNYRCTIETLNAEMERILSLQILRTSLFQAGFTPCGSLQGLTEFGYLSSKPSQTAPLARLPPPQQGLIIRRMSSDFFPLPRDADKEITAPVSFSAHAGDSLIMSNCLYFQKIAIKKVNTNQSGTHIHLEQPIDSRLRTNGSVGLWIEESFYINRNGLYYKHRQPELLTRHWQALQADTTATRLSGQRLTLINNQGQVTSVQAATPNV